jgi:Ca2+-binding RTX toxin-like protein
MRGIRVAAGIVAGAALACLPQAASAAPACTYVPAQHLLRVTENAADHAAVVSVAKDGSICGGATVTNTDTIQVFGLGDDVDLRGTFEPGFSAEPGSRPEIEIAVSNPGVLRLDVPGDVTQAAVGAAGVNLNGDDDADVTTSGTVDQVQLRAGKPRRGQPAHGFTITGQGGLGTGAAYAGRLQLVGGKGDDHLIGGNGENVLRGLAGNDTLDGGPMADFFEGDAGNDTFHALDGVRDVIVGGTGTDTAVFDAGLDKVSGVP